MPCHKMIAFCVKIVADEFEYTYFIIDVEHTAQHLYGDPQDFSL